MCERQGRSLWPTQRLNVRTMPTIDHVMVAVANLEEAARRYASDYGLIAVAGGRHDGLGTANSIVPLGDDYVELVAVVDGDEAAGNPVGQFLSHHLAEVGEGLVAVCLRTSDAAATIKRTGSSPVAMSRTRPDGHVLSWELIGMDGTLGHGFPFFITWALDEHHPARTAIVHRSDAQSIAWVELGGDAQRIREWVGADAPQLRLVGGESGPRRFAIATRSGDITIE